MSSINRNDLRAMANNRKAATAQLIYRRANANGIRIRLSEYRFKGETDTLPSLLINSNRFGRIVFRFNAYPIASNAFQSALQLIRSNAIISRGELMSRIRDQFSSQYSSIDYADIEA